MPSANVLRLLMCAIKQLATFRTWVRIVYTSSAAYQVPDIKKPSHPRVQHNLEGSDPPDSKGDVAGGSVIVTTFGWLGQF